MRVKAMAKRMQHILTEYDDAKRIVVFSDYPVIPLA